MNLTKKAIAECLGTFVLVFFACGTAMATFGKYGGVVDIVGVALSFGLVIVAMAYAIGGVSGCHINPAVSIGVLLAKKMTLKEFFVYIGAQFLGAIIGAAVLYGIFKGTAFADMDMWATNGVLANAAGETKAGGYIASLALEIILTFVFVFTILVVTSKKENGKIAGLVIGLTLTLVHLLGIFLTGTSVNPVRSFGPALMAWAFGGGTGALKEVWVFIVAPLIGGVIAAFVYNFFYGKGKNDFEEKIETNA